MSSKVQLCLANVGLLDRGSAQLGVDQALAQAVNDAEDRGDDGKPRTVTIKVIIQKAKTGAMEVQLECGVTLPSFKVNPTLANVRLDHHGKRHVLDFQPMSPANPDQNEIPYDASEAE